jgi:hypothetical protein
MCNSYNLFVRLNVFVELSAVIWNNVSCVGCRHRYNNSDNLVGCNVVN